MRTLKRVQVPVLVGLLAVAWIGVYRLGDREPDSSQAGDWLETAPRPRTEASIGFDPTEDTTSTPQDLDPEIGPPVVAESGTGEAPQEETEDATAVLLSGQQIRAWLAELQVVSIDIEQLEPTVRARVSQDDGVWRLVDQAGEEVGSVSTHDYHHLPESAKALYDNVMMANIRRQWLERRYIQWMFSRSDCLFCENRLEAKRLASDMGGAWRSVLVDNGSEWVVMEFSAITPFLDDYMDQMRVNSDAFSAELLRLNENLRGVSVTINFEPL